MPCFDLTHRSYWTRSDKTANVITEQPDPFQNEIIAYMKWRDEQNAFQYLGDGGEYIYAKNMCTNSVCVCEMTDSM